MGFEDIEKRMATKKPRSMAALLAFAGVLLVVSNFVANAAHREYRGPDDPLVTTYWLAVAGGVCLVCAGIAKRYPNIVKHLFAGLFGVVLIAVNMVLDDWFRASAVRAGQSSYLTSHWLMGLGCATVVLSLAAMVGELRRPRGET